MSSDFHDSTSDQASPDKGKTGHLAIELPHWAAQVSLYDSAYRPVPITQPVRRDSTTNNILIAEANLPPGVYEVEATLQDRSSRNPVAVYPGRSVRMSQEVWGRWNVESAAPVEETSAMIKSQIKAAEECSKETTWKKSPGGEGRLFLFLRSLVKTQPERELTEGLQLLNEHGVRVTDFSEGIKKDDEAGWVAFTANLQPGFYILRREQRGRRLRHQAFYISAGWETQAFLAVRRYPSMRRISLSMAPLGAGFQHDDKLAVAVDVMIDFLWRNSENKFIFKEPFTSLLKNSRRNPWLGIVASYVLIPQIEPFAMKASLLIEKPPSGSAEMLNEILDNLRADIPDHPDVRALCLTDDAGERFPYPPILWPGLKRVQQNALRFPETIPVGSLTDCILDEVLTDSPWTAWRHFKRLPTAGNWARSAKRRHSSVAADHDRLTAHLSATLSAVSPKTPAYPVPAIRDKETFQTQIIQRPLHDVSLLQVGKKLTDADEDVQLPEETTVNSLQSFQDQLASISSEKISKETGIPLARVRTAKDQLANAAKRPLSDLKKGDQGKALAQTGWRATASVLQHVITSDTPPGATAFLSASSGGESAGDPALEHKPQISIEESIEKLQAESRRLLAGATGSGSETKRIVRRMNHIVRQLLRYAEFSIITSASGKMLYGNGAFLALLCLPVVAGSKFPGLEVFNTSRDEGVQQAWEHALKQAPLGCSALPTPVQQGLFDSWDLQRTAIKNPEKALQAYLNVLRGENRPKSKPDMLDEVATHLSMIALYGPLVAYSTQQQHAFETISKKLEDSADNFARLEETVGKLKVTVTP